MLSVSKLVSDVVTKAWETFKYNGLYNLYSTPKTLGRYQKKVDNKIR